MKFNANDTWWVLALDYIFLKNYWLVWKRPLPPSQWDETSDFYLVMEEYTIHYQFKHHFYQCEKEIGKKAYRPLAELEKGHMLSFHSLLPPNHSLSPEIQFLPLSSLLRGCPGKVTLGESLSLASGIPSQGY